MAKLQKIRVTAMVVNKDQVLLLRRASKIGVWEFPAGSIGFGELPEKTAERELEEETGLKEPSSGLLTVNSCMWKSNLDDVHEIVIVYLFKTENKDVNITKNQDHEHSEYKWVKIGKLKNMPNLAFTVKCILKDIDIKGLF